MKNPSTTNQASSSVSSGPTTPGRSLWGPLMVALLALSLAAGCAEEGDDYSGSPDYGDRYPPPADSDDDRGDDGTGADPGLPEERRDAFYRTPQASDSYVFVVNTARNTVVRMDPTTLALTSIAVGAAPTAITTVANTDTAVVLNSGNDEASIIRADESGNRVSHLPITAHYNTLVAAPAGGFVLAYYREDIRQPGEGIGGLQDLSVIVVDLEDDGASPPDDRVINLSIGPRPSAVFFDPSGTIAHVVTDAGLSLINLATLTGPDIAPTIPLNADPMQDPGGRSVSVTPDGRFALVTFSTTKKLTVVDLANNGAMTELELDDVATDLAITPDGNRGVLVMRAASKLMLLNLREEPDSEAFASAVDLEGRELGAVAIAPCGTMAILFTTINNVGYVYKLNLETGGGRIIPIQRRATDVAISPDSRVALVFHPRDPSQESQGRAYAYSLIQLESGFVRENNPPAEPGQHLFTSGGDKLFLAMRSSSSQQVTDIHDVNLQSFVPRPVRLGSPPEHLGELSSAGKVFVSQSHPTGRITFISVDTGEQQTVTGFELNEMIR